jgi:hypothetical protein
MQLTYERDIPLEERLEKIAALKNQLGSEDAKRNREFARVFSDKNSELYECWNKQYSWSGEYRGNNSYSKVGSKIEERGCKLADYIYGIDNTRETFELLSK